MEGIILLVLVVVVIVALLLQRQPAQQESLPVNSVEVDYSYQLQESLFSPAEQAFYDVLKRAIGDQFIIFGKVRVADVLTPQSGLPRSDWQKAFNKISAKHFDFVLCTRYTLSVEAVIELDDSSHRRRRRIQRDEFLNHAVATAGLNLIRFPVRATYDAQSIKDQIASKLQLPPAS